MSKLQLFVPGVLAGILCFGFSVGAASGVERTNPGLEFINKARSANGLPVFKYQIRLRASSKAHCRYAKKYQQCGHHEDQGVMGFTGEWPWDRAHAKGYLGRSVSEATALFDSWLSASENLMSGIYHRTGLLRFDGDEMGAAVSEDVTGLLNCYCFLSGSSTMREFCSDSSKRGERGYWGFCRDERLKFTEEEYDRAVNGLMKAGPEFAVYPWRGQSDVLPIFENVEYPSPLPGIEMSGMPVSIHFNPYKYKDKQIKISRFALKDKNNDSIVLYPQFDITTDPERFGEDGISRFDFAWFPVFPLRWNQQYSVSLSYITTDKRGVTSPEQTLSWSFKTRRVPHTVPEPDRVVVIEKGDRAIRVPKYKPVTVILESGPQELPAKFESVTVTGKDISFEGINVIRFTPIGKGALSVLYQDGSKRDIHIRMK